MKTISATELTEMFANVKTIHTVELLTNTDARLKVNPWGEVRKESRVEGVIGSDYAFDVNSQLVNKGDRPTFRSAPLQWGQHADGVLIEHKGNYYVQVKTEKSHFPRYLAPDGKELPKAEISPYLPKKSGSNRQAERGLEEKEQVKYVSYGIGSIKEIVIDGDHYVVTQ